MDYAVWYNILLQMNIKDIKKIFKINSIVYGILQDKYFWIKKFENDKLSIPSKIDPQNMYEWIRLYIAVIKARVFINTILTYDMPFDIYIDFYSHLNEIFSKYINYINKPIFPRLIISTDTFLLDNQDEYIVIPKNLLLDILTHVYYVNYDKYLVDTNNGPYDINKINSIKSYKYRFEDRAKYMNNQYIQYGII